MKRSISILFSLSLCLFLAFSVSLSIQAKQRTCFKDDKGGNVILGPENRQIFACPLANGDTDCRYQVNCQAER